MDVVRHTVPDKVHQLHIIRVVDVCVTSYLVRSVMALKNRYAMITNVHCCHLCYTNIFVFFFLHRGA